MSCQSSIKVPHFYCKQRSRFTFRHLTLMKSLKRFITEYIPDDYYIINITPLLWLLYIKAFFKETFKMITWEKNVWRRYSFCLRIAMMKLWLTLKQKLFELLCIENDVSKFFAKYCNFDIFVAHYSNQNDTFLYSIILLHNFTK